MYVCRYISACIHLYMKACLRVFMYACMHVCMDGWMHECMHMYACVCAFVRACTYAYGIRLSIGSAHEDMNAKLPKLLELDSHLVSVLMFR